MAITGTLTVGTSAVASGQPLLFTLVVSNSGGADVTATGFHVYAGLGLPGHLGGPRKFGTSTWVIPAGGTLTVGWQGEIFAAANLLGTNTTYTVRARIDTDDGNAPTVSSSVNVTITPTAPSSAAIPLRMQANFTLNLNAFMIALGLS